MKRFDPWRNADGVPHMREMPKGDWVRWADHDTRTRELEAENKALREGRGVKVKPLEWRDSYGVLRAETPFGDYMVIGNRVKIPVTARLEMMAENPKAAAQADYERRILSALAETEGE